MDRAALRPALAHLAEAHDGLFTRTQALAAGYSEAEIRARLGSRTPDWRSVRRGVYVLSARAEGASVPQWRWWGDLAAHLTMALPHALSHDSAARALEIPLLDLHAGLSHVTRTGVGGSRTQHGVKHHLGRERPARILRVQDVPVTGRARTALDLAREHGFSAGVVAMDHVLARGATMREFELELARMTSWPYVKTSRAALAFADPGAESVGESLTRVLLAELGWGPLVTQFPVPVAGGVRWCDLRVGRHLVEFDGAAKFRSVDDGGFAIVDPAQVAFLDRQRDTDVGQLGLGISHVSWRDLFSARREAKARLRPEEAPTRGRYGSRLPDELVRFAVEHRRSRAA
ncbi:MAG: hypothetical protein KC656_28505 [Myxococcales bacterium]|nr:hypothetical protein [Myxococcales bacterium]